MESNLQRFLVQLKTWLLFISVPLLFACEASDIPINQSRHTAIATYDADIADAGNYALVASVNHGAGYWDLNNDVLVYSWSHGNQDGDEIIAVDIAASGNYAVTATATNISLWDTKTGKSLGFYKIPDSDLRDLKISNTGRYLVMGLGDGRVIHLNLKTGRRLEFLGHSEAINSIDISPNGRYVLSGGNDFKAIFWDSKTGQPIDEWLHNSRVILVSLSRDASYAFSSGNKADANIWNLIDGNKVASLDLQERQYVLSSARFSPDNQYLLTGAPSRQLALWQTQSGKLEQLIRVSTRVKNKPTGAIIYAVGFDSSGNLLSESSAGWGERWQKLPLSEQSGNN